MCRLPASLLVAAVFAGLLAPVSCKSSRRERVQTVEEDKGQLLSAFQAADPAASLQLVDGFHDIEQNAWRWTKGKFTVTFKVPEGAAQKGGTVEVKFNLPGAVLDKVQATSIRGAIGGIALEPEKLPSAGDYTYKRDIPASALSGETATVDFALDKFLAAGQVEQRELGVIVTSFSLASR